MPYADPIKRAKYEVSRKESRKKYFRERYFKLKSLGKIVKRKIKGTGLGYKGEIFATHILKGSKRVVKPTHDLEWQGKKIEVKTAIKKVVDGHDRHNKRTFAKTWKWKFLLTQLRKTDFFLIICKNRKKETEHIFLIPDKDLKVRNLTISESKIEQYFPYRLSS